MNRLKLLRNESQKKLEDIAKYLNVSLQTISNYENGKRDIPTDYVIKLANYFGVTTDYLLGNSDDRTASNIDDNDLHFALSKEDSTIITDEMKDNIKNYIDFVITQEKNKKDNK